MEIRVYIRLVVIMLLLMVSQGRADSASSREYQIKAAFVYNFIKFVEWPKEKVADSNEAMTIGILGKDPFGDIFESINDKQVQGKKVLMVRFESFAGLKKSADEQKSPPPVDVLSRCDLLFISSSEKDNITEILQQLRGKPVLTISETDDFLKSGGIINFVIEDKKVCFEINVDAAKECNLELRSKLLRLARCVIHEEKITHQPEK